MLSSRAFIICILLFGCAGKSNTAAISLLTPNSNSSKEQALVPVPIKWEKTKIKGTFDLKDAISQWIEIEHPNSLEEVVRYANTLIRKHGFPLQLDASRLLKKNQRQLELKAGKKLFSFSAGHELNITPNICGEQILKIPAVVLSETQAALVSNGKQFPFSLAGFGREKVKVFRKKKLVATLSLPEPTEPLGISPRGNAVYIKFALDETITTEWWTRVVKDLPMVIGEDPYLVLKIEKNKIKFDSELERLIPQEFEVQDSNSEYLHWRFLPSNLILELSSHCGPK